MAAAAHLSASPGDPHIVAEVREAQKHLRDILNGSNTEADGSFTEIPIIDIASSFFKSQEDRKKVAEEIRAASTVTGFFYIRNHGISSTLCDETLRLAKRFFQDLPRGKKEVMHIKNSKFFRGWKPVETVSKDLQEVETKEAFNWGYQEELDFTGGDGKYLELDGTRNEGNVWPKEEDLPVFFEGLRQYYGEVLQLSRHLMGLFALSLSLEETYFDALTTHPGGVARLLYYPARDSLPNGFNDEPSKRVGIRPHSDFECFTILLQSDVLGLQVLSPNG